jgi:hypothetical protein
MSVSKYPLQTADTGELLQLAWAKRNMDKKALLTELKDSKPYRSLCTQWLVFAGVWELCVAKGLRWSAT